MALTGHHRIRSIARRLATPILLGSGGLAGYAFWLGEVPLLRVAAVTSVVAGFVAVVLFDYELIRERRDHAAERAMQAKAYIDLYARRFGAHVQAAVPAENVAQAENVTAEAATPVPQARAALAPVENVAPVESVAPVEAPVAREQAPARALPAVDSGDEAPELWQDQDDAPTVVDLIAYEMRARLAQEERRERAERSAEAEPRAAASG